MKEILALLSALTAVLGAHWYLSHASPAPSPQPAPIVIPVQPPPRRPLLPWREAKVGGDVAPDGTPIQVDFPRDQRMKNTGGRDGAGLCVFTSINHAARWQYVPVLDDFQKWMKSKPGGGYPEKVDAMIAQKCKEAGVPKPDYIQITGNDLSLIKLALKTGRMVSNTYGYSPSGRYGGGRISHMVSTVHAVNGYYGILDNNYIDDIEWLSEAEYLRTYTSDGGWSVILLSPGPPPVPRNKR